MGKKKRITRFYLLDSNFQIVLVGLTKMQIKKLPKNIIGIARTEDQVELAKFYSSASYFVNPTYEDNYPTVNLEAIACGTKVIAYDTGGCKEQINKNNGIIVPRGDIQKIATYLQK